MVVEKYGEGERAGQESNHGSMLGPKSTEEDGDEKDVPAAEPVVVNNHDGKQDKKGGPDEQVERIRNGPARYKQGEGEEADQAERV